MCQSTLRTVHTNVPHTVKAAAFAERANGRHDHAERMYEKMIAERGNMTGESAFTTGKLARRHRLSISELLAGITGRSAYHY